MIRIAVHLVLLFTIGFYGSSNSQNLCPNPGFEQLSGCPTGNGEIHLAFPWIAMGDTADLFSFCHVNGAPPGCDDVGVPFNFAGYSQAHGGSTYAGIVTKGSPGIYRTYIQAPLTSPMTASSLYKAEVFFKRSSYSKYATNRLGLVFSTSALSQTGNQNIPLTPHGELKNVVADTGSWTKLTAFYEAAGGESYITIGNFRSDNNTTAFNFTNPVPSCLALNSQAYYYIDDVLVTPITEQISFMGDTIICQGDTSTLTGITNTTGYWSLFSSPNDTIPAVNNSITISPSVNTTYLWNGIQTSLQVVVSIAVPTTVTLREDTAICYGDSVLLNATGPNSIYYNWSNGATTAQIYALSTGTYIVTVSNDACEARDTFLLDVSDNPLINFGTDSTICTTNNEFLELNAGPGLSYQWTPVPDTSQIITVSSAGVYSVTVTYADGCTMTENVTVLESCPETLFLPGAFTPNNDGKNDLFFASGTNIHNFQMKIFNRWGQLIYEFKSLGDRWNGMYEDTEVPAGMYIWRAEFDILKENGKFKPELRHGSVLLYR
jgi:gliding motility-associated-like protein